MDDEMDGQVYPKKTWFFYSRTVDSKSIWSFLIDAESASEAHKLACKKQDADKKANPNRANWVIERMNRV